MEFILVAILCVLSLIGILAIVNCIEVSICTSKNRCSYLVVPVGKQCENIDIILNGAMAQAKGMNSRSGAGIIIVDLGMSDEAKKIVDLKGDDENILLLTPEELKNFFYYCKM